MGGMIFPPLYKEVSSSWTRRTGDTVTGLCHHGKAPKRDKNHFQGCVQRQKCEGLPPMTGSGQCHQSEKQQFHFYFVWCVRACVHAHALTCKHVEARQRQRKMSSSLTFPPYFWRQSLLLNPKLADELRLASKPRDAPVSTFPVAGWQAHITVALTWLPGIKFGSPHVCGKHFIDWTIPSDPLLVLFEFAT